MSEPLPAELTFMFFFFDHNHCPCGGPCTGHCAECGQGCLGSMSCVRGSCCVRSRCMSMRSHMRPAVRRRSNQWMWMVASMISVMTTCCVMVDATSTMAATAANNNLACVRSDGNLQEKCKSKLAYDLKSFRSDSHLYCFVCIGGKDKCDKIVSSIS